MSNFAISYTYNLKNNISPEIKKIANDVSKSAKKIVANTRLSSRSFSNITHSLKVFKSQAVNSFKSVSQKVKNFADNNTLVVSSLKKISAGIVALGTASAVSFGSLEMGLVNVQNLLPKQKWAELSEDIKKAQQESVKMGFSITDTNKALFDTISALGGSKESLEAFRVGQKLAIGGVTSVGVAVDGITSIVNAYGRETTNATKVANAFFTGQVAGKTTVEQLSNSIGRVAPTAKAAGIGFEELIAGVSALTLGGLSTDEAVTSLQGALSSLIKPADGAREVLESLGIPFGQAQIEANGLSGTFRALAEAQEKYGVDAIAQAIPNIRAFTAVTSLNEEKLNILDQTVKQINKDFAEGTGLTEAYARVNNTLNKSLARTIGSGKVLIGVMGEKLSPSIKKGLNDTTKLSNSLTETIQKGQIVNSNINSIKSANINSSQNLNIGANMNINFKNAPQNMSASISNNQQSSFPMTINQTFAR